MFAIIPVILALLIAQFWRPPASALPPWWVWLLVMGSGLLAWSLLNWAASLVVRQLRWQRGPALWDLIGTQAALALFAVWCNPFGLGTFLPLSLLQVLPFLALLLIQWYQIGRTQQPPAEAWAGTWNRFRLGILPVLVLVLLMDGIEGLTTWMGFDPATLIDRPLLLWTWTIVGLCLALALLPLIITRLWRTRRIPEGPLRQRLESDCRRFGIACRHLHLWPAGAGRFYNAAVLGLFHHTRYLLISEDLLRSLRPNELRAVLGHELGHIRHRHIWFYLAFVLTTYQLVEFLLPWCVAWSAPLLQRAGWDLSLEALVVGWLVLLFVLFLRGGFGIVSRACERQADLAGAELAGGPEHMQDALRQVAALNGQDPRTPSWMHGSIAERITYLERVRRDPGLIDLHHRGVMKLKFIIIAMLALAFLFSLQTAASSASPEWLLSDPERRSAVEQAQHAGNSQPLYEYLLTSSGMERVNVARAVLGIMQKRMDEENIGAAYEDRHLLIPFASIPTGQAGLDLVLDNQLAYVLVAGTTSPTPYDLDIASRIVDRLHTAAKLEKDPMDRVQYLDTVGCVKFRLDRRPEAQALFTECVELLGPLLADPGSAEKEQHLLQFQHLLQRRLAACDDPEADLPLEEGAYIADPGTAARPDSDPPQAEVEDLPATPSY